MNKSEMMAALRAARVVPVVRTSTAAYAATAVRWLRDAGIRIFELTMTIPDAPALIRELAGVVLRSQVVGERVVAGIRGGGVVQAQGVIAGIGETGGGAGLALIHLHAGSIFVRHHATIEKEFAFFVPGVTRVYPEPGYSDLL